jgi:predicted TPR repeat methyltransferase
MLPIVYTTSPKSQPWVLKKYYETACQHFKLEKWSQAASLLNHICSIHSGFKPAQFKLATCQMQLKFWDGAEQNLISLIENDDPDPNIMCNLAITYWQKKNYKSALIYFKFNLKHFPSHIETRQNLASFYLKFNRIQKAILQYQEILYLQPELIEIRFNLAACLQQLCIYDEAIVHYRHIIERYQRHDSSLYNLACIYYALKNFDAARFFWEKHLLIRPNHQITQYMLNHLQKGPISAAQHQSYIEGLFDHYASFYDQHMQETLNYQFPSFLESYLSTHAKDKKYHTILELGCGTGLCAKTLHSYTMSLIGVDISQEMLKKASTTGLYQKLHHADIIDFLSSSNQEYDLIVALDVTPYILDLDTLLKRVQQNLNFKGSLFFSIEVSNHYPYQLQGNGRFSFHPDFIKTLCQNLNFLPIHQTKIMARTEHELPVIEQFYHWEKP